MRYWGQVLEPSLRLHVIHVFEGKRMSKKNLYIERRKDQGDYAVKHAKQATPLATAETQARAIEIAKRMNPGVRPDVERVRNTTKGSRDKWRKA